MIEFELSGQQYRAGKLSAFQQFHVSRRVAPLIPALIPVFVKMAKDGSLTKDLEGFGEILTPFADGLAAMSDESAEYVIAVCLSVVRRKNGDAWTPVWSESARSCMFDDMDMGAMIPIIIRVIQDSLGNFIRGMLTGQEG